MIRVPFAPLSVGALAAAAFAMAPAIAQSNMTDMTPREMQGHAMDPHQPQNDGSAAASASVPSGQVAPGVDPGTRAANGQVTGQIADVQTANATAAGQYANDRAAYDDAMRQHGRQVARQDAHYAHQQQAYADAMAAWRVQEAACKRGNQKACASPAPDPADYY